MCVLMQHEANPVLTTFTNTHSKTPLSSGPNALCCITGGAQVSFPQLEELCSLCWLQCMGSLCLSTRVAVLIWLLHSGDGSGKLPKSRKEATVEGETMNVILIPLETTLKCIHFLCLLFFHRVKLVLLVLLVLVVVLEREENLVLKVMLGHLDLRYVNTVRELRRVVPPVLHKAVRVLWFSLRLTVYLYTYVFFRALQEELEALATRVKWWVLFISLSFALLCW